MKLQQTIKDKLPIGLFQEIVFCSVSIVQAEAAGREYLSFFANDKGFNKNHSQIYNIEARPVRKRGCNELRNETATFRHITKQENLLK